MERFPTPWWTSAPESGPSREGRPGARFRASARNRISVPPLRRCGAAAASLRCRRETAVGTNFAVIPGFREKE